MSNNPLENDIDWNSVQFGGVPWEGKATVSGFARQNEFDVKQSPGAEGGTSTYRGNKLAEGKITLFLWEQKHWDVLPFFMTLLKFDPTSKTGQAIDVWHPSFDCLDPPLRGMVVKSFEPPKAVKEGDTLYSMTIEFLEYRPPKKKNVTSTSKGSKNGVSGSVAAQGDALTQALKDAMPKTFDQKQDEKIGDLYKQAGF